MDLRGWEYTGRNIAPELHHQYRMMCKLLSCSTFVSHQTWGNPLQEQLAMQMGASSSGAIRTIKKMFVNFGFLDTRVINSHTELYGQPFLTKQGELLLNIAILEEQIHESEDFDEKTKENAYKQIKILYEEVYCDALAHYYIKTDDGENFCPLRATLQSLSTYQTMDKWEWYLMNTFIRHDDNESEKDELNEAILKYRKGELSFTMENFIEKPKGHQYTPQHYDFAGLVNLSQRPNWLIKNSDRHMDVKALVLSDTFLDHLYQGRS